MTLLILAYLAAIAAAAIGISATGRHLARRRFDASWDASEARAEADYAAGRYVTFASASDAVRSLRAADAPASLTPFLTWLAVAFAAGIAVALLAQHVALSAEPMTVGSRPVVGSAVVADALRGVAGTHRPGTPEFAGSNPAARDVITGITATEDSGGEVTAPPASEASGPDLSGGQPGHRRPAVSDVPRDDPALRSRSAVIA